ncbi:hypothetical protein P691DRAFT_389949 [Macrolepiota fuliginosa MF-IS2]|uniref:Uncharacterized protein n=1 Tax=Macrolepiota fuliginosa MF-IS2 TaxID=1400762 RepID=A0A9P5X6G8_9AGAR|nr:hypothetical protein P691DRAFT_389949 [Macrolepiota fuliginosa MF-IS2]
MGWGEAVPGARECRMAHSGRSWRCEVWEYAWNRYVEGVGHGVCRMTPTVRPQGEAPGSARLLPSHIGEVQQTSEGTGQELEVGIDQGAYLPIIL